MVTGSSRSAVSSWRAPPDRSPLHVYLQPDREVDEGAIAVHGITNEYLKDKPRFREVANDFFEFIRGAQLIIHNAAFDIGFINNEFALLGQQDRSDVTEYCSVLDTLLMARERHPGQRNNLDALCKRYGVDNPAATCTARCSTPRSSPTSTWR